MPNPVAPTQMSRGTGRRKQAEQPPPYVSDVPSSGRSHVKGKGAYGLAQGDTAPTPSFHSQTVDGRFGFHEPTHLVPPGSEPDLRALNNPYVAERTVEGHRSTTSQNQRPVSTGSGVSDLAHQLPRLTCNGRSSSSLSASRPLDFEQHLDPSLQHPTAPRKARPNRNDNSEGECVDEDGFWQGYHGEDEDNLNDKASEESDDEVDLRRRQRPTGFGAESQSNHVVQHTSLPPDDDFEYSRDEAEENAADLLRTPEESSTMPTADVLDRHQQTNGQPRAPDPAVLTALQDPPMTLVDDRCRAPRHSRRPHDQPAPPNHIGHYGPVWKDCLEAAKIECRAVHALSNPWPRLRMDVDSLTDGLTTVVMQWTQRGVRFEPGCWLEKKTAMIQMLYEDLSTWRSEMKKAAISSAHLLYQLAPAPGVECPDRVAFVQDAAATLLNQSILQGKTRNFAHPAIKDVIHKFFYTGSYRIAHRRPDVFRTRIPNPCLATLNCALDGYSKNGTGKWFPKFSAKAYASIYNALLGLIEETSKNPYHGPRLSEQLACWAREGWAALQQVDMSVERHGHLQIVLD
ncbi:hypothetical protein EDD15DRAFT_2359797 [Pisolithus albus]|nr:hypothetical protein EDD15DRAFT_2359797 [Pisolithus albus]